MSTLALSRLSRLNNSATTYVVSAAANRLPTKPMIPMESNDHHHGHDSHMSLPNQFQPSTVNSFKSLIASGNLRATNAFTSI